MVSKVLPNNIEFTESDMELRYKRAGNLINGLWTDKSAQNALLFPIWIGDTDCFWYERQTDVGSEYRLVDARKANNISAFDHTSLATALAENTGKSIVASSLPLKQVTMDLDSLRSTNKTVKRVFFTAFKQRWVFDCDTENCTQVNVIPDDQEVSPDGRHVAFRRDFNLWVRNIDTGEERALTYDGEECYVYAIAGSGWGYTMEPMLQVRWSPDSKRLYTVQRDTRQVKATPVVHHVPKDGSLRPTVVNYKVAYPGDANAETLRLLSIELETGCIQAANYRQIPTTRCSHGFFSANLGWWSNDSRRAYFVDMERGDQIVRVVEFDTHTGAIKILFEETSKTQINLMLNADEYPTFMSLPESSELLWFSERSGWAHLYLYDLQTGKLKNVVTQGEWVVRQIVYIDQKRREVFIQTAGRGALSGSDDTVDRDPYYRDLCRVHLDTGELTTVIASDHEIIAIEQKDMTTGLANRVIGRDVSASNGISPTGDFAVVTRSRADECPVSLLIGRSGEILLELEIADISALPNNWQWPEPVKVVAADGHTELYGLVFRPSDFSPDLRYPVISHVYNTPELPFVAKGSFSNGVFYGYSYSDAAALAELGFIVVQIDARGTPFRDKSFHDEGYGWLESVGNLDDHIAGIQQLAKSNPYMDLERVGILSRVGGPGAVQALFHYPEFYKVGVAGFYHDSRIVTAPMWGHKYEGLSGPSEEHKYPEEFAENLQGKLLLTIGMLDTSTPPATTFRIIEALQKANKDFDLIALPNLGHASSSYLIRRMWDYLVRNLLGAEPPKNFKLVTFADS